MIVNPLMVTFFQLRLTRRVQHVSPAAKLAVAMPLMGLPFLLLSVSAAIPVVMLADLPLRDRRDALGADVAVRRRGTGATTCAGAYMGAFGSGAATGFALAPFFGLTIGDRYGDGTMWAFFAVVSVVAGVSGAIAARGVSTRPESEGLGGEAAVA